MDTRKVSKAPERASHDPDTPEAFVSFMSSGWLDAPITVSRHGQIEQIGRAHV